MEATKLQKLPLLSGLHYQFQLHYYTRLFRSILSFSCVFRIDPNVKKEDENTYCVIQDHHHFIVLFVSGGREVFSQSKSRSARHKNRQRHSGEPSTSSQNSQNIQRGSISSSSASASANQVVNVQEQCKVLKETVFSSEIHSIEYNSPIMSSGGSSSDSPKMNKIAKNINVDTGNIGSW